MNKSCTLAVATCLLAASNALAANHPVLIEGNCDSPVPGTTIISPAGTCGDYDGDGRIGTAEDTDGADRIFGTIKAALGPGTGAATNTGINNNGTATIVTSGRFAEQIIIDLEAGGKGNVTLQAAPGVAAMIDAVFQGDPAGGNDLRRTQTGITILGSQFGSATLRNLTVRNWNIGVHIKGGRVAIEELRISDNFNGGVVVRGSSRVSIDKSEVLFTGFRKDALGFSPASVQPDSGAGLDFGDSSTGAIFRTNISGNFGPGIVDSSSGAVNAVDVYQFDNNNHP